MPTAIISTVLLLIVVFSIRSYAKKMSSDCGGGDTLKSNPVADTDISHYPYKVVIGVGGMTCGHCVAHVENVRNAMDGVWATVNLKSGQALVRCKQQPDLQAFHRAVVRAGYQVQSLEQEVFQEKA